MDFAFLFSIRLRTGFKEKNFMVTTKPVEFSDLNFLLKKTDNIKADTSGTSFFDALTSAVSNNNASEEGKTLFDSLLSSDSQTTLNQLKQLNSSALQFTTEDITSASEVTGASASTIQSLFSELRTNLMSGIKESLTKLETAVNDPAYGVTSSLKTQFNSAISSIKNDFTTGFGENFDTYEPVKTESNTEKNTYLLNQIYDRQAELPKGLIEKLQGYLS